MVIDVFSYNGEKDLLDLHLNTLTQYVDKFIVVEAKTTFSGNQKPLYFSSHEQYFQKYYPKIEYFVIDERYSQDEIIQAETSPNTLGAKHWKREFLQKESIQKALIKYKVQDEDTVFIGDVDELWQPVDPLAPMKLKLMVYAYYLNNRSTEEFWGTFVAKYKDIKGKCLNHLRTDPQYRTEEYYGWHFTSMGGVNEVRRKLDDSYTKESYNTYAVQAALPQRLKEGTDYLGRDFTFQVDDRDWPTYLTRNKAKYKHLLK